MSKVMSMSEAIAANVGDGDFVFVGGYICRTPFSAVHELIRQGRKDLTITRSNAAEDFDMLIGAGWAAVTGGPWSTASRARSRSRSTRTWRCR
jgi:glutaconate CoA-transferase subunit A